MYSFEFVPIGRRFACLVQKVSSYEGVERRERNLERTGRRTTVRWKNEEEFDNIA